MKNDVFKLTIPSKPDYISVARLTSSSIACKLGLSIDEIEDIKVSLSEACTKALEMTDEINIKFEIMLDKLVITVEDVIISEEKESLESESYLGILL